MWLWCFLIISSILIAGTTGEKQVLHILGLSSWSGPWRGGDGIKTAAELGVEQINARDDILPEYKIEIIWEDVKCDPGYGVNRLYKQLFQEPPKIMILGAACSAVSEATAMASYLWNLVQMSYISGSPALSIKKKFPWFFRTTAPNVLRNGSKIKLIKIYKWRRVATIHQSADLFSIEVEDLVKRLQNENITLITSEIFTNNPAHQVANLKRHNARIINVGCYEDKIYQVFCEAFKQGMYGKKYVWFVSSFYSDNWWTKDPVGTDCTTEEVAMVAEGAFGFGRVYINRKEVRGLGGLTPSEWKEIFWKRMEGLSDYGAPNTGPAYDAPFAMALALNSTEQQLKDQGSNKTLSDFNYNDDEMARRIYENTFKVTFQGIKGWIQFDENGDCEDNVRIRRIQDGERKIVAYYDRLTREMEFLSETPIKWIGGSPPMDSTINIEKRIFVNSTIYIVMSLFAAFGICLSIFFLIFMIAFRKLRIIKMSSPRMNHVIVIGCVIAYITVFLQETSDELVLIMCKVRMYALMVGFSLAFGALFAKTWRVYAIFMNQTKKVVIKDERLMLLVAAIVSVDVVIGVIRELVDPMEAVINTMGTIELDGGDKVITNTNWICTSEYDTYFKGVIFGIKGLLLIFGAFLAFQTRKVQIADLNDSQYIGMCIYNVAVLSVLGVVLAFALTDQVDLSYIFTCCTIIFGTTSTQFIIFIPKINKFRSSKMQTEDQEEGKSDPSAVNTIETRASEDMGQVRKQLDEAEQIIKELTSEIKSLKDSQE